MAEDWVACVSCRVVFRREAGGPPAPRCPACSGSPTTVCETTDGEWYYARNNKERLGPVSWGRLRELAAAGEIGPSDMVWRRGAPRWSAASSVPGLLGPATPALRQRIHADLEYRLRAGEAARVEDYLGRFPELAGDGAAVLSLIAAEDELLRQVGARRPPEEYLRRFPQYREELLARLTNVLDPAAGEPGDVPGPVRPAGPFPAVAGYEVLGELGRGGMGVVYKAWQKSLARPVALKMVRAGDQADRQELERFRFEAEAAARLQHPNIVQVYEVGEHEGRPYFSLEFVDGTSLAQKLAGTPLPPRDAAGVVETLARAVQAAHDAGIIHRDLKPANVLLAGDPGAPVGQCLAKVADFGLAKRLEDDSGRTRTGAILGTPSYMAPEQASGRTRQIGPPADVYALGAVLYECLTGHPPFRAATVLETLELVRTQDPVPPSRLQPKVPRDLETVCLKCLEKEPAKRYASAGAFADDLARFLGDRPVQARPPSLVYQFGKFTRRHKALVGGVASTVLALVLAVAGTTAGMLRANREKDKADTEKDRAAEASREAKVSLVKAQVSLAGRKLREADYAGALELYREALRGGHPDEAELRLEMADCLASLGRAQDAEAEINALAARGGLGKYEGRVLFLRGKHALIKSRGGADSLALFRQALEKGLSPADAAVARGLLAPTYAQSIAHLKESLELDPFRTDALDILIPELITLGQIDEASRYVAQARVLLPRSTTLLTAEAQICALRGDMARAEAFLGKIKAITGKEPSMHRTAVRFFNRLRRKGLQWEDDPQAAMVKELLASADISQLSLKDLLGGLSLASMMSAQMKELPFMKARHRLVAAADAAAKAGRRSEAADRTGDCARAEPTAYNYLVWGTVLSWAGRLAEAEEVLEKGVGTPCLIDCRARILMELLRVQELRSKGTDKTPPDLTARPRMVRSLNRLAALDPLPPSRATTAASTALSLNEPLLALKFLRDAEPAGPLNVLALNVRAAAQFQLGAYPQALETVRAIQKREPANALAAQVQRRCVEEIRKLKAGVEPRRP